MILGIALGIALLTPGIQAPQGAVKLYTDSEIVAIRRKFKASPKHGLLNFVPNGKTKPLSTIFKLIEIDPKRTGPPRHTQLDFVDYHIWQVSPSYDLSIMVAVQSRADDGYGVRLQKRESK